MVEDEYRKRTNLHRDSRSGRTEKKSSFSLFGAQLVICIAAIAVAGVIKLIGGGVYTAARSTVSGALKKPVTQSQVSEAFAAFKSNFPDMKTVFSNSGSSSGSSSEKNSSSQTSSSSQSSSSSASSASAPSSSGVKNVAQKETEPADSAPAVLSNGAPQPPSDCSVSGYTLPFRLIWPVSGNLSSGYGYRIHPITNELSFHKGIDIAAAKGTPVAAAFKGSIETVGVSSTLGNYVVINHGSGVETLYAHLSAVLAKKGTQVKQGASIAKVGSTGESTGYHLHFAVKLGGKYVDPLISLPKTA